MKILEVNNLNEATLFPSLGEAFDKVKELKKRGIGRLMAVNGEAFYIISIKTNINEALPIKIVE